MKDVHAIRVKFPPLFRSKIKQRQKHSDLDRDKSKAIWIATLSNFQHKLCAIEWTKSVITLGVQIGNYIDKYVEEHYKECITKLKTWPNNGGLGN